MASAVSAIAEQPQLAHSYSFCCDTVCAMGGRMISYLDPSSLLHSLKALVACIQNYISACFHYWMSPEVTQRPPARPLQHRQLSVVSVPHPQGACSHCNIRHISEDRALIKMVKNAQKALAEHVRKAPIWDRNAFATATQAAISIDTLRAPVTEPPLQVSGALAENIGLSRPTMQDAHCFVDLGTGTLAMVCDGHGPQADGDEVARYTAEQFQARFPAALLTAQGNVHKAFETLIHAIHSEAINNPEWNEVGSTAVISYIDKASHRVYTATLGDSEATLYRNFGSVMKAIPLSPVRDWSSPKDAARAAAALGKPDIARLWPLREGKTLRFHPNPTIQEMGHGVNVSRAMGDKECAGQDATPGVVHKTKITVFKARPGDRIVLACDGLRDFGGRTARGLEVTDNQNPENQIVREVKKNQTVQALADDLVQLGLKGMTPIAGDNITVLAINIF